MPIFPVQNANFELRGVSCYSIYQPSESVLGKDGEDLTPWANDTIGMYPPTSETHFWVQ